MAPRKRLSHSPTSSSLRRPRQASSSGSLTPSGSSPNLNAKFLALVQSAETENRDPYNNKYTFTARGSQKVASKARAFIKAALLVGGVAALGFIYKRQISNVTGPLFEELGKKYPSIGRSWSEVAKLPGMARGQYAQTSSNVGSWFGATRNGAQARLNAVKLNAASKNPGFGGRTMQVWQSASRGVGNGVGRARNGIGGAYGAARKGVQSRYAAMMQPRVKPTFNQVLNNETNRRMRALTESVAGKTFPLTKLAHEQERGQTYENIIANLRAKHAKSSARAKRIRTNSTALQILTRKM
jgi:hypothetical protein